LRKPPSLRRGTFADLRRRSPTRSYFLALAYRHGWRDAGRLAASCSISSSAVYKHWRQHPPSRVDLTAGSLCLGDDRLTAYLRSQRSSRSTTATPVLRQQPAATKVMYG